MIFCARATRGLGRPSLDARSGDQSAPIPEEIASELGGIIHIENNSVERSMRAVKDSQDAPDEG